MATALSLWLTACGEVCATGTPIIGPDGGSTACLIGDTCPRAGLLVCTNLSDLRRDCVACQQNTCQRLSPGTCR